MKHSKTRRKVSLLRWVVQRLLTFMVIVNGASGGIVVYTLFSMLWPSVAVAVYDPAPTPSSEAVLLISSFESSSRTEIPVTAIVERPVPTVTPVPTVHPLPTATLLPSPTAPILVVSSNPGFPRATVILPPCAPGEEFFHPVDGRRFDNTLIGGGRGPKFHPGIDGSCRRDGQAKWVAYAVADAIVVTYKYLDPNSSEAVELWSSGWTVVLAFTFEGAEYEAIYGHLEFPNKSENWPKVGDPVSSLSPLGRIGSTGASSGLHLHFGLRRKGADGTFEFINPEFLLGKRPKK